MVSCNFYRIFSQEIPSDVNIHVGGGSFSLHKVQSNPILTPAFQFQVSNNLIESITVGIGKVSYYPTSMPFAICKLL